MRTTLNLDQKLIEEAMELSGIKEKTEVLMKGLQYLISIEAGKRLAKLGGTMPKIKKIRRKRGSYT